QLRDPITLRSGTHVLSVIRGDGDPLTLPFIVRRGPNEALRIEFEPNLTARREPDAPAVAPGRVPDPPVVTAKPADLPPDVGSPPATDSAPGIPTAPQSLEFSPSPRVVTEKPKPAPSPEPPKEIRHLRLNSWITLNPTQGVSRTR